MRCRGGRRGPTLSFSEEEKSGRDRFESNHKGQAGTYRRGTRNEKIGLLLSVLFPPSSEERGLGTRRRMRQAFGRERPHSLLVRYVFLHIVPSISLPSEAHGGCDDFATFFQRDNVPDG